MLSAYNKIGVRIHVDPEDARIQLKDPLGNEMLPEDGIYFLIQGTEYQLTIEKEGYEKIYEKVTVAETENVWTYQLKNERSQNADLKHLYVSSSDKYGKGILALNPVFQKEKAHYNAEYDGERGYFNLWAETADKKAEITVYAISGVREGKAERDGKILPVTRDGKECWPIYLEKMSIKCR